MRQKIFDYVKKKYSSQPEYLWKRFPDYAVFRHADNNKWYGIVMGVSREKLGLSGEGSVDILNIKLGDPYLADTLIRQEGFLKGYHISRGNWVSILLDGTVAMDTICDLLDESFTVTASRQKRQAMRPPKEWIIPANPKYYDVEHAFDQGDVIDWKQGNGIKTGDTVYMYVAAPVSAILYACRVLETGIPCDYEDGKLTVKALMKIRLTKRYRPEEFPFAILKEEYGIYAVRGPRGIPEPLSRDLK